MTGYEKSPDYGSPKWGWPQWLALVVLLAGAGAAVFACAGAI